MVYWGLNVLHSVWAPFFRFTGQDLYKHKIYEYIIYFFSYIFILLQFICLVVIYISFRCS